MLASSLDNFAPRLTSLLRPFELICGMSCLSICVRASPVRELLGLADAKECFWAVCSCSNTGRVSIVAVMCGTCRRKDQNRGMACFVH